MGVREWPVLEAVVEGPLEGGARGSRLNIEVNLQKKHRGGPTEET